MTNLCFYLLRYIFESKENKKEADSKKKSKGTKGEKVPQQKVIARLQVDINLLLIKRCFMISIVVYFATWRLQYCLLVFILSLFLQLSFFSSSNFFGGDD